MMTIVLKNITFEEGLQSEWRSEGRVKNTFYRMLL